MADTFEVKVVWVVIDARMGEVTVLGQYVGDSNADYDVRYERDNRVYHSPKGDVQVVPCPYVADSGR